MKILVVKLTSMGDVLHLLPALSDLLRKIPDARIDWMIEDSFSEIPTWHPAVDRVLPVSTRRWRRLTKQNVREFWSFLKLLRAQRYDVVIDAQGLMKSAALSRLARLNRGGKRIGFSADCIKEKLAARFYRTRISIDREQHAIDRLRQLFALGFDYPLPAGKPDYGMRLAAPAVGSADRGDTIMFFHGTTWDSKHLPEYRWRELRDLVLDDGYLINICWNTESEKVRAEWIADAQPHVKVLPKLTLKELAQMIKSCAGVIAVDTGLGHMAAALGVPAVSIYGATDPGLTGAVGASQTLLACEYRCSPCFLKQCDKLTDQVTEPPCYKTISNTEIWQALYRRIV